MPRKFGFRKPSAAALCLLALLAPAALARTATAFQETGAEIAARQAAADRVLGPPAPRPRFSSPRRRAPGAAIPVTTGSAAAAPATPRPEESSVQTLGVNFLGANLADSGAYPPDTSGAAGPTQFLVGVNGRLRTFGKTTGISDGGLDVDTDVFFASVANGQSTFSPRVRYDRTSGRWYVTALNFGTSLTNNRILFAASNGGTISGTTVWTFSYFEHDLDAPPGDAGLFFDVGTLGIDGSVLVVGGNLFDATGAFQGASVHVIRKSALAVGGDLSVSNAVAYRNLTGTPGGAGPYAPTGVDNLSDASSAAFWVVGVNNILPVTSELVFRKITFSAPGAWPPSSISANVVLPVPTTALPLSVPHLGNVGGTDGELDALDDRLFDAKSRGGHVWTAQNIAVDATGAGSEAGDRDGVRWYEIDVSGASPTLVQSGTLFDDAASNPRFYWMPSMMVTGQHHAALGASAAGGAEYANGVAAGRLASDAAGVLGAPSLFTSSIAAYNPPADPGGPRRWGDYSFTSLDPADDMTLWTIQEYCNQADSWGVRVVELLAPPPATPASGEPPEVGAGVSSVDVFVTGTAANGSGFFDPGAGYAGRLHASVSGGDVAVNSVTFVDPTSITLNVSTVGAASGPRTITITNPDGQTATSATGLFSIVSGGPPPEITSIAPTSGLAAGGAIIELAGTNFIGGATVTVGGVPASGPGAVTSATTARVTAVALPPGSLNDVTLVNPDSNGSTLGTAWFADFLDVPQGDPFHPYVETIFRNGITAGCGGGNYCRNDAVSRAQMAVFLLKAKFGAAHAPPPCHGIFDDVTCPSLYADWIEELYAIGITGGCSVSPPLLYCPGAAVSRAQMAALLLKTSLGSDYPPPNCTGTVFTDVPCAGGVFDPWIEDLARRGITGGCGPGVYCPAAPNTRGQMAVFLTRTFGLP